MTLQSALPVSQRHIEPEDMAARYSLQPLAGRAKAETATAPLVAIVIESDSDRRRLTETLRALHAQVVVHENLKTLRRCLLRGDVDFVITDVTLPDANWADVLRLIVHASLTTSILVRSRTADDRLRCEAMWRGACGLLVPPYSLESVNVIFRDALSSYLARR
jgi:DNA-binding NtrC family response regulator